MNFTDSPFEREIKEKPYPKDAVTLSPPDNGKCRKCPYWRGIRCVSCYRDLMCKFQTVR